MPISLHQPPKTERAQMLMITINSNDHYHLVSAYYTISNMQSDVHISLFISIKPIGWVGLNMFIW